jgi:hypothetical protein
MLNFAMRKLNLELTDILTIGKIVPWAKQNDRLAPSAGHHWFWRYLPTARESARSSVSTATGPILLSQRG